MTVICVARLETAGHEFSAFGLSIEGARQTMDRLINRHCADSKLDALEFKKFNAGKIEVRIFESGSGYRDGKLLIAMPKGVA